MTMPATAELASVRGRVGGGGAASAVGAKVVGGWGVCDATTRERVD